MYRIIGADQKEYGPVSADQLRQWIAEGRASGSSLLRPEGGVEWLPLSSFAEFAEALAAKTPPGQAPTGHGHQTGFSYEVLSRDYDLDIGHCVGSAGALLKNNFGLVCGGTTIYLLVHAGISGLSQIPIIGVLLGLASIVVTGPLTGGLYFFFIKNVRHQVADIGDIFAGFSISFGQLVLGYLVTALLTCLAALPGAAFAFYPIFTMVRQNGATPALVLWAAGGVVLIIMAIIYLSVSWVFTLALIIDRQMDFWPAMEASRKMVGKHWVAMFALLVVCGLVNLAGVAVCCVGFFVSFPISVGAIIYAYETAFSAQATTAA